MIVNILFASFFIFQSQVTILKQPEQISLKMGESQTINLMDYFYNPEGKKLYFDIKVDEDAQLQFNISLDASKGTVEIEPKIMEVKLEELIKEQREERSGYGTITIYCDDDRDLTDSSTFLTFPMRISKEEEGRETQKTEAETMRLYSVPDTNYIEELVLEAAPPESISMGDYSGYLIFMVDRKAFEKTDRSVIDLRIAEPVNDTTAKVYESTDAVHETRKNKFFVVLDKNDYQFRKVKSHFQSLPQVSFHFPLATTGFVTAGAISGIFGFFQHLSGNRSYDAYLEASNTEDVVRFYKETENKDRTSFIGYSGSIICFAGALLTYIKYDKGLHRKTSAYLKVDKEGLKFCWLF